MKKNIEKKKEVDKQHEHYLVQEDIARNRMDLARDEWMKAVINLKSYELAKKINSEMLTKLLLMEDDEDY